MKHVLLCGIVLFAAIVQGGYFMPALIVLNASFMIWLLMDRRPVRLDIGLVFMLLLFAVMAASAAFRSVDGYAALHELLKYSLFPLSYAVFRSLREDKRAGFAFDLAFFLLMAAGLMAAAGFSAAPGMVTVQGNRLQSFLQYANTTALLMGAGALLSLDRLIGMRNKWQIPLALLFGAAMLLTQSRTTLVLFLIILLLYAFDRLSPRAGLAAAGGIAGLAAAVLAFGGRLSRISLLEPTLVERIISFHDAARILAAETFGLGLGPGSWQYLQFAYQSAPYQVRYVHNVFLQAAMDGGVLALLLLAGWWAYHLARSLKARGVYFYLFLFIALHSLFEVDFNFGIVILFFSYVLTRLHPPDEVRLPKLSAPDRAERSRARWLLLAPLLALVVVFASEAFVARGDAASRANPAEAYRLYETALRLNPLNRAAMFKLAKIDRNPDSAIAWLEKSRALNPHDDQVLAALSEGYRFKGDFGKSYFYAEELFRIFPYHRAHQEQVRQILSYFHEHRIIDEDYYLIEMQKLEDQISALDARIHPMYRHIRPDMDY